jgi:hypothetical protein
MCRGAIRAAGIRCSGIRAAGIRYSGIRDSGILKRRVRNAALIRIPVAVVVKTIAALLRLRRVLDAGRLAGNAFYRAHRTQVIIVWEVTCSPKGEPHPLLVRLINLAITVIINAIAATLQGFLGRITKQPGTLRIAAPHTKATIFT